MIRLLASTMVCMTIGSAVAQEAPLSIEGLAQRNARLLVAGVAYGFHAVDSELTQPGFARLYCPPADVDISGNYLWDLAEQELNGDHDLATVTATVLERLKALYPCSP